MLSLPISANPATATAPQTPWGTVPLWLGILLLAMGYACLGRLGLWLAIPPGYASPIWPAAGFAVAVLLLGGLRLAPGVLLGSFLVNIWEGADFSSWEQFAQSTPVPLGIAAGATLQAMVGYLLVRRHVGDLDVLRMGHRVLVLMFVAGPVACVLSASIGVGALVAAGVIQPTGFGYSLFTWWVGDSIGVLIFAPLVLLLAKRPYRQWWRQQTLVATPLLVTTAAAVALFFYSSQTEQQALQQSFVDRAGDLTQSTGESLRDAADVLVPLQSLFHASEAVSQQEFRRFSAALLKLYPQLFGMGFAVIVNREDLAAFQARLVELPGEPLTPRPIGPLLVGRHVLLRYAEPDAVNGHAIGIDLATEPTRFDALRHALESGGWAASAPLRLATLDKPHLGAVLALPVYARSTDPQTPKDESQAIGFVLTALNLQSMLTQALTEASAWGIHYAVSDNTGVGPGQNIVQSPGFDPEDLLSTHREVLHWGNRKLHFAYQLDPQYLLANRSWRAWSILAGGLLFTGLFGALLLVLVGRNKVIEEVVQMQTADLARSNRDLAQFAYVISHDLKAPLRTIGGFAQIIEEDHGQQLPPEARALFNQMRQGTQQMGEMVSSLLQLAQIGQNREPEAVNMQLLLEEVLSTFAADMASKHCSVHKGPLPTLPGVRVELKQLLQNLVGNALKFQTRSPCRIDIRCEKAGSDWLFSVRDQGPGIPDNKIEHIFAPFARLDTQRDIEGQGIGLSICQRVVETHGGKIWAENAADGGAIFLFRLPAKS